MPLYTSYDTQGPRQRYLEELPVEASRGRGAAIAEGFSDTFGVLSFEAGYRRGVSGQNLSPEEREEQGGDERFGYQLSQKDAQDKISAEGYSFDIPEDGVNSSALQRMMDRQHRRALRQSLIARSQVGGVQQFLLGVLGSLPDPVNIAVLPFAPEAAAIKGLGMAARVGHRAATGAKIGLAEATLLEPAHFQLANAAGDDLTMFDAFANIAVGGILGGTLHVGGGVLRDWKTGKIIPPSPNEPPVRPADPEGIQAAVSQLYNDQKVDVDPIVGPKVQQRMDDYDMRIRRALDEGDRNEARLLARRKETFREKNAAGKSHFSETQLREDDLNARLADTNTHVPGEDIQAREDALNAINQEKLNSLATKPRGERFIDVEKEAQATVLFDPNKKARPAEDGVGPLEAEAKSLAEEETNILRKQIQDAGDEDVLAKFDDEVTRANEGLAEAETFSKAVRAAALCSAGKGRP